MLLSLGEGVHWRGEPVESFLRQRSTGTLVHTSHASCMLSITAFPFTVW